MAETADQSTTPQSGLTNTLLGWSATDPDVAAISPWFILNYGVGISGQFMSFAMLQARIAALPPAPPPTLPDPTVATVHNGDAVPVRNWDNTTSSGPAVVADGALTAVDLPLVPTSARVNNGAAISVRNWDNTITPGPAVVAANVLTQVAVPLVATRAAVNDGAALPVTDAAGAAQAGSPGAAHVAGNAVTSVQLSV